MSRDGEAVESYLDDMIAILPIKPAPQETQQVSKQAHKDYVRKELTQYALI